MYAFENGDLVTEMKISVQYLVLLYEKLPELSIDNSRYYF